MQKVIWCRSVNHDNFGEVLFRLGHDDERNLVLRMTIYSEAVASSLFIQNPEINLLETMPDEDAVRLIDNASSILNLENYKPSGIKDFRIIESENTDVLLMNNIYGELECVLYSSDDNEFLQSRANFEEDITHIAPETIKSVIKVVGLIEEEPLC
ncbi:hypothetical protein [Vibrio sp. D431a]|uniref:hypothetical protein n=1 Tax=Vibrio sp. D431a TaxID=2837388 RepID=UPI00255638DC|nr:hypothetical protein [Vibrio sp. D431a]MDK9789801.1 hypothetical protein [Vibrio sp. D431a]